jgi:hypothetical protein
LLNDSSFAAIFSFRIGNNGGGSDADGSGEDGLAFVVQTNSNNVGAEGGGLGYQGINNSVAVEFDTYNNGSTATSGNVNVATRFNNGAIWDVTVSYNGITDLLNVTWSSATTDPVGGSITQNVDLATILGSSNAFMDDINPLTLAAMP